MDQQIQLLQEIHWLMWLLICLALVFLAVKSLRIVRYINTDVIYKNLAKHYFERGKYDALIDLCSRRMKKRPFDAEPFWHLGRTYYRQKKYTEAVEFLRKAIALEPSWKRDLDPYLEVIEAERKAATNS